MARICACCAGGKTSSKRFSAWLHRRVHRANQQAPGFRGTDRHLNRFQVAHFADHDNEVLAQGTLVRSEGRVRADRTPTGTGRVVNDFNWLFDRNDVVFWLG